jgi:hypothetical protein
MSSKASDANPEPSCTAIGKTTYCLMMIGVSCGNS